MMKLNLKIRLLRHFTGMDQQQVAAKLHISVADYSRIDTGTIKVDDAILESMLSVFDLKMEQFGSWPNLESEDLIKNYLA